MSSQSEDVPAYEIVVVPGPEEEGGAQLKQQCLDLRMAVFCHEQGFSPDVEFDALDEVATHILLRLVPSLKPIGTIRVTKQGDDQYRLGRLVVLSEYRKHKLGQKLVEFHKELVLRDARTRGLKETIIHCDAQAYAIPFYAKFGYVAKGEPYIQGVPTQRMECKLTIE